MSKIKITLDNFIKNTNLVIRDATVAKSLQDTAESFEKDVAFELPPPLGAVHCPMRALSAPELGADSTDDCRNILKPLTGIYIWPATVLMCAWLHTDECKQFWRKVSHLLSHFLEDKKVLELGCGSALIGATLSKAGAASVLCTDNESEALSYAARICELNNVKASTVDLSTTSSAEFGELALALLDWSDAEAVAKRCGRFDAIVMGELLYAPDVYELLLNCVYAFSKWSDEEGACGGSTHVYCAFTERTGAERAFIRKTADDFDMIAYTEVRPAQVGAERCNVVLCHFKSV